jgi:hypothetical protein
MWVLNSIVFLIPAVVIAVKELSPRHLMRDIRASVVL